MQEQATSLCACGCGRALSARAGVGAKFVRGHYWRAQKRPFGIKPLTPLAERVSAKIDKTATCWLWTGAIQRKSGYGLVHVGPRRGHNELAHRVMWELTYGPIPEGRWVLHHCDVRACVRPEHLFLGDQQANMDDMNAKGRGVLPRRQPTATERARGERQGSAKLTEQVVREIRERYRAGGVSQTALAAEYGIGQNHVSRIVLRQTWVHIP